MKHRLSPGSPRVLRALAAAAALGASSAAGAVTLAVTVTAANLAPANGVSFAPLHLGFHAGTFDVFDIGDIATEPIISVAEGGVGGAWQSALAAQDPGATRGIIGGALQPGETRASTFIVDTAANPFFTFASMVVPSNDFFIGNDSPTRYRLFDDAGNLLLASIGQTARQIWDAGSEVFDPAAAAFLAAGNNDLRAPQGSVVAFNFAELAAFNGLTTATGYVFDSTLAAQSDIYRISFEVTPIPEPGTYALLAAGLLAMGWIGRRRGRHERDSSAMS